MPVDKNVLHLDNSYYELFVGRQGCVWDPCVWTPFESEYIFYSSVKQFLSTNNVLTLENVQCTPECEMYILHPLPFSH